MYFQFTSCLRGSLYYNLHHCLNSWKHQRLLILLILFEKQKPVSFIFVVAKLSHLKSCLEHTKHLKIYRKRNCKKIMLIWVDQETIILPKLNRGSFVSRRSSKQVFLKNFASFTGKHLCWSPLFITLTPTQVLSCEICEIFKSTFFTEHLRWLLLFRYWGIFASISFWKNIWISLL